MNLPPASSFPVPYSPTWQQQDSTKIKEAMRCLRRYFYRYVLGWRIEGESIHLVAGAAWHLAQEHLLKNLNERQGYPPDVIQEAFNKLLIHYREHYGPDMDDVYAPKDPANMLAALVEQSNTYRDDHKLYEVINTEIAGQVPIGDNRSIVFKIDGVLREKESGKIIIMEHKTSAAETKHWGDQWVLSIQVGAYIHAMYCFADPADVKGAIVNGVFLRKKGNGFQRYPILKTPDDMQVWLNTVNYWYDQIEMQFAELSEASASDDIMECFPMNPEACTDFGKVCPYFDLCTAGRRWKNPIRASQECIPEGYIVEHWNPLEEHLKTATLIDLEKPDVVS